MTYLRKHEVLDSSYAVESLGRSDPQAKPLGGPLGVWGPRIWWPIRVGPTEKVNDFSPEDFVTTKQLKMPEPHSLVRLFAIC